jgi:transcriptional regulator GlxA family with amidase domain
MNTPVPFSDSGRSRLEARRLLVAVVVFPEVEELAMAAPFAVFGALNETGAEPEAQIFTVAETPSGLRACHGLRLVPDFTFERCPRPDVLVLPGGPGTPLLLGRPSLLEWIRTRSHSAQVTLGAASGVLLLARAGLLEGLAVTTQAEHLDALATLAPGAQIDPGQRFLEQPHPTGTGKIVTTPGGAAGLDALLHAGGILYGEEPAARAGRRFALIGDSGQAGG